MNRAIVIVGALVCAASFLVAATLAHAHGAADGRAGRHGEPTTLTVLCAAGLRRPIEEAAKSYEREQGVRIALEYGGSGQLLSTLGVARRGDLFIAADPSYTDQARAKGLIRERFVLAEQRPLIAVAAGNPKHVVGLDDLLRTDVRIALTNPEVASIGRLVKGSLGARWEGLAAHASVLKPTVNDLVNDLRLGTVDAAIVWDALVAQTPGLDAVPVPEFATLEAAVTAGVCSASADPREAIRFARWLAAPDRGGTAFATEHYRAGDGDPWSETPTLTLFSGSVNRLAIEPTLKEFAEREGAKVSTVVNGCGILCATMRSAAATGDPGHQLPDAYYACDTCFVPPVADLFPSTVLLTDTEVVIATQRGNPKGVHTLVDLAQPGLRVGIGNAEQSSLGYITKRLLEQTGMEHAVMANASSQVPTADLLANQLMVGSLDAAIVYRTTVLAVADKLEAITIKHPGAKARQPFSIAAASPHRRLAERLLETMQAHRADFEAIGFHWREDQRPLTSAQLPPMGAGLDGKPVDGDGPRGQ